MFCARCGKEIDDDSTFCPFCSQKVGESVENKKEFRLSSSGGIRTVKLIGSTVVGLAVLTSVVFGVSRFAGRSEVKKVSDTAEESEGLQEAADFIEQSGEPQEDLSAELDSVISGSDEDNMYSIRPYTLCNRELKDFFQLHLGCYLDYCYGNCKTEPVNISTMLEHTGVIGAIELDEGMRVVSDYSDNLFSLSLGSHDLNSKIYNRDRANYSCSVLLKETNAPDTFRYYKGTDAQIGIVAEVCYYVDNDPVNFENKYAVVLLRNSAENSNEWLFASAFLISEFEYSQVEGESFDSFLVSEDIEGVEIEGDDWKQSYLDTIKKGELDDIESYCLRDINNDNIPELYIDYGYGFEGTWMYYVLKDGSVKNIPASNYNSDKVFSGAMHQGAETFTVYQYDSNTGDYILVFDGYYEDDYSSEDSATNHKINGQSCSREEYEAQVNALWNPEEIESWWEGTELVSNKSLIDAIAEY